MVDRSQHSLQLQWHPLAIFEAPILRQEFSLSSFQLSAAPSKTEDTLFSQMVPSFLKLWATYPKDQVVLTEELVISQKITT